VPDTKKVDVFHHGNVVFTTIRVTLKDKVNNAEEPNRLDSGDYKQEAHQEMRQRT